MANDNKENKESPGELLPLVCH